MILAGHQHSNALVKLASAILSGDQRLLWENQPIRTSKRLNAATMDGLLFSQCTIAVVVYIFKKFEEI